MAKVNIEFDTKTKDISVTFDGKAVANVYSVSLSKSYYGDDDNENPFSMSLMTLDDTKQKEDGYRSMEQIVAKHGGGAKELINQGASTHPDCPDFLLLKKTGATIAKGLAAILASRRGLH